MRGPGPLWGPILDPKQDEYTPDQYAPGAWTLCLVPGGFLGVPDPEEMVRNPQKPHQGRKFCMKTSRLARDTTDLLNCGRAGPAQGPRPGMAQQRSGTAQNRKMAVSLATWGVFMHFDHSFTPFLGGPDRLRTFLSLRWPLLDHFYGPCKVRGPCGVPAGGGPLGGRAGG